MIKIKSEFLAVLCTLLTPITSLAATNCTATPVKFSPKTGDITVGEFHIHLDGRGEGDPTPDLWEGPVKISGGSLKQECSIDFDDVGIIKGPILGINGTHLVMDTYSGSEHILATIDLPHCKISAQRDHLYGWVTARGLLVSVAGKPVKGLTCDAL